MESTYQFLLSLGGILLVGQAMSTLGHRTILPRITLLLIFGVVIGKDVLNIIPPVFSQRFEIVAEMTLMMVGFLIGGKLTMGALNYGMNKILWISVCAAVFATVFVILGLLWFGLPIELAILLGCIASATAPAAILDVVIEADDKSHFSNLLVSIVALDDAWALLLFGVGIAIASSIAGHASDSSSILAVSKDIGGAVILGLLIGFPAAYLTGRLKPGEPIITEALGLVFICGGFAIWLGVSFLIASIVMGAVVANFAKHHDYPFHAIENIEWPFMVIFFVLAGATIELKLLGEVGLVGVVYILCRILGKIIGARIGCQVSNADQKEKRWMGIALLPQAGVSIGMALVASSSFPEYRQILLSIILGSTVFFEIVGPLFTRIAIQRAHNNSFKSTPKDDAI
jgi:Kef-type K+ transport system membrane component KefB